MSAEHPAAAYMDERPRPPINRGCSACDVRSGAVDDNLVVVSPGGVAHFAEYGTTSCGEDATGDEWWWPL